MFNTFNRTLTGNFRYRNEPRLFRRPVIVLQVEYKFFNSTAGQTQTAWRDAVVEDLLLLHNNSNHQG